MTPAEFYMTLVEFYMKPAEFDVTPAESEEIYFLFNMKRRSFI